MPFVMGSSRGELPDDHSHVGEMFNVENDCFGALFFDRYSDAQENTLQNEIVSSHNTGQINFLSLIDDIRFSDVGGATFFLGQHLICKIIPELSAVPAGMMCFVRTLVQKGGNDLAANYPNAAFQDWCRRDLSRAETTIELAKMGDGLAAEFLTFALVAGNFREKAIEICRDHRGHLKTCAVTALARMSLADKASSAADLGALRAALEDEGDEITRANILGAAIDVAGKGSLHGEPLLAEIVNLICSQAGEQTHYGCARALCEHAKDISPTNLKAIFQALLQINPEHKGTLERLDVGLRTLLDTGHEAEALKFIAALITKNDGVLQLQELKSTCRALECGSSVRLQDMVIQWLLRGCHSLRDGLSKLLQQEATTSHFANFDVSKYGLTSLEMIFLCRKAIGFFFLNPVIAASIIVGVIRNGDEDAALVASELLFDPLLINYGGSVRTFLEGIVKAEPELQLVQSALRHGSAYLDDLRSIGIVKELNPSENQRQVERMKMHDQSREVHKEAEKHSILMSLMHRSTLLYGRRSLTYVSMPGEQRRPVKIELQSHSFSFEMPRLEIVDPHGLNYMLWVFRVEKFVQ
jgi:hypothetical protein